eukprot:TRINITY_DN104695_c0_g1_i1.p1 TRINITY_DN104695_c0_g1~~TRINITY_DN104695_c0_g1_i1.p1  ORF type:complete len:289 (+),score=57.77 TRINITY_DN104695_c0_g1_i1:85-951(+)
MAPPAPAAVVSGGPAVSAGNGSSLNVRTELARFERTPIPPRPVFLLDLEGGDVFGRRPKTASVIAPPTMAMATTFTKSFKATPEVVDAGRQMHAKGAHFQPVLAQWVNRRPDCQRLVSLARPRFEAKEPLEEQQASPRAHSDPRHLERLAAPFMRRRFRNERRGADHYCDAGAQREKPQSAGSTPRQKVLKGILDEQSTPRWLKETSCSRLRHEANAPEPEPPAKPPPRRPPKRKKDICESPPLVMPDVAAMEAEALLPLPMPGLLEEEPEEEMLARELVETNEQAEA